MEAAGGKLCDCTGLPVTCASREAVKLFDELLVQFISVRKSVLPLARRILALDPDFILVHCLMGSFWLSELVKPSDPRVSPHIEAARGPRLAGTLTEREEAHVQGLEAYAGGSLPRATEHWSSLLLRWPRDIMAIRILFVSYIVIGEFEKMRDSIARCLPHWGKDMAAYPFILGFYGFALEETNYKDLGEAVAREALSLEKNNPWATHTLGHVIEEARPVQEGVEFLTGTRENWAGCLLEGHINWHLSLFYLELQDVEAVLREYDSVLVRNVSSDNRLGLIDASSLLWRMELVGVAIGDRWTKVVEEFTKHIGKHGSSWYDAHLMLSLCHGRVCEDTARLALTQQMIKSLEQYAESGISSDCTVAEKIGVPCCKALLAYSQDQYSEVLSLLLPLRYDLHRLGGSWAQRQIFNLTLIQAAIRQKDLPVAMALVAELKAQKPYCQTLARLFEQLKASHDAGQTTITMATPLVAQD